MTRLELIAELLKACETFLEKCPPCPESVYPRIAMRHLQLVIDALEKVFVTIDEKVDQLPLYSWPIDAQGKRATEESTNMYAVIVWLRKEKTFGYGVNLVQKVGNTVRMTGLPGSRQITLEDIVELQVRPHEIVQNVKLMAEQASINTAMRSVTQPPARA